MSLTDRELWALVHGIVLGGLFLVAYSGGLAELFALRRDWETREGQDRSLRRLVWGTLGTAALSWLAVISGTFRIYPWYRASPAPSAALSDYPRSFLLSRPELAGWHTFAMEWKEHVAWLAPILATAAAFIVWRYRGQLVRDENLRRAVLILFTLAFVTGAVAGILGALITKAAPLT